MHSNINPSRKTPRRSVFRNEDGMIDLLSIIVGVILIGIAATGVVAMVFQLVPWAQDNAAKQNLDAVGTAEGVHYVQGAETGDGTYELYPHLVADTLIQPSTTMAVAPFLTGTVQHYVAVSKSATGARYYITDSSSEKVARADLPGTLYVVGPPEVPGTGALGAVEAAEMAEAVGETLWAD